MVSTHNGYEYNNDIQPNTLYNNIDWKLMLNFFFGYSFLPNYWSKPK